LRLFKKPILKTVRISQGFIIYLSYSQNADCTVDASLTNPEGVVVRTPIDLSVGFVGEYLVIIR